MKKENSKVAFFYNMNPHNPTGKVMGKNQKYIIEKIGELAIEYDFYIIDDLIYRDLSYDKENMPLAVSSYNKFFDNTISLFGISKSYNLASIRSGFIVSNERISYEIQNKIYHTLDSISVLNIKALTAAFNIDNKKYYKKYFKKIINEYLKKYYIMKFMIDGIDSIDDLKLKRFCIKKIKNILDEHEYELILNGIENANFVEGLDRIESGFFALLEINNKNIIDDFILFDELYNEADIKVLCGGSIMYPDKTKNIIRINYSVSDKEIIKGLINLKKYLDKKV